MGNSLKLSKDNIREWKFEYDIEFVIAVPWIDNNMSNSMSDDEHLEMSEGMTPKESVYEELTYWMD